MLQEEKCQCGHDTIMHCWDNQYIKHTYCVVSGCKCVEYKKEYKSPKKTKRELTLWEKVQSIILERFFK